MPETTRGASAKVDVTLRLNGSVRRLRLDSHVTLLDALRDELGLTGTKLVGSSRSGPSAQRTTAGWDVATKSGPGAAGLGRRGILLAGTGCEEGCCELGRESMSEARRWDVRHDAGQEHCLDCAKNVPLSAAEDLLPLINEVELDRYEFTICLEEDDRRPHPQHRRDDLQLACQDVDHWFSAVRADRQFAVGHPDRAGRNAPGTNYQSAGPAGRQRAELLGKSLSHSVPRSS
jgi:hypothetical protein